MEIGVVGDDMFTIGFRLVGIEKWFTVNEKNTVDSAVKTALGDKDLGILVIHDKDWNTLESSMRRKLSNSVKPTVIAIGSEVDEGLRDRIKTAIGVDPANKSSDNDILLFCDAIFNKVFLTTKYSTLFE